MYVCERDWVSEQSVNLPKGFQLLLPRPFTVLPSFHEFYPSDTNLNTTGSASELSRYISSKTSLRSHDTRRLRHCILIEVVDEGRGLTAHQSLAGSLARAFLVLDERGPSHTREWLPIENRDTVSNSDRSLDNPINLGYKLVR